MTIEEFLQHLVNSPQEVAFDDLMQLIEENYHYSPVRFTNGNVVNEAGSNEGSCKLFAFAHLHALNEQQTLECFGRYYRDDVLQNPQGDDHANIRQFMLTGWSGIEFDALPLEAKR